LKNANSVPKDICKMFFYSSRNLVFGDLPGYSTEPFICFTMCCGTRISFLSSF